MGTRIKRSEGGDIALAAFKLGGALIEKFGTASGSETAQNIGIVVELLGELIENTANNAQHSEETFSLDKQFIYGLIYKVQNKQNLLEVPGVKAISMKKSEFLDAKHIRLVLFVCHKRSDVISNVHSSLICFCSFLRDKVIPWDSRKAKLLKTKTVDFSINNK